MYTIAMTSPSIEGNIHCNRSSGSSAMFILHCHHQPSLHDPRNEHSYNKNLPTSQSENVMLYTRDVHPKLHDLIAYGLTFLIFFTCLLESLWERFSYGSLFEAVGVQEGCTRCRVTRSWCAVLR